MNDEMKKDDGGSTMPKFKITDAYGNLRNAIESEFSPVGGMSIRDWFAGQALAGLLAAGYNDSYEDPLAKRTYRLADAMLKARGI